MQTSLRGDMPMSTKRREAEGRSSTVGLLRLSGLRQRKHGMWGTRLVRLTKSTGEGTRNHRRTRIGRGRLMSDRDELAREIHDVDYYGLNVGNKVTERARDTANALRAAGWRKMPSVAELTDCIISVDDQRDTDVLVAAILALLDGPTETREK